jgi:hypothetical protein
MYAKISNRETTAEKVPLYLAFLNGMQSATNVFEFRKYKDSLLRSYHPDCNEGSEVTLCLNPTEWVHASRVISAILSSATQPEIIVEIIETIRYLCEIQGFAFFGRDDASSLFSQLEDVISKESVSDIDETIVYQSLLAMYEALHQGFAITPKMTTQVETLLEWILTNLDDWESVCLCAILLSNKLQKQSFAASLLGFIGHEDMEEQVTSRHFSDQPTRLDAFAALARLMNPDNPVESWKDVIDVFFAAANEGVIVDDNVYLFGSEFL